jgi:aryl-phospho-beta-D-glucosidase BglC (GH1 family)
VVFAFTAMFVVCAPVQAQAQSVAPAITARGVQFVNAEGQPVVLRGVDVGYQSRYYTRVADFGANFARIRVLWSKIEPKRDVFNEPELARLDQVVQALNSQQIAVELDLRGSPAPAWFDPKGFWRVNAAASHAAYKPFVKEIVQRYDQYPYVIGFGIYNEPHPFTPIGLGTHKLSQTMLTWQATIRDQIRKLDPSRLVFFEVRGGNYGIKHADFKAAGFGLSHVVYDWHSFYNGAFGSGFDKVNENWIPSWPETHNQRSTVYEGTQQSQWLNFDIAWKRTHLMGIPMIVGEWGVRDDDAGRDVYDQQMGAIFDKTGVSFARWAIDSSKMGLMKGHDMNDQGQWLAQYIQSHNPGGG